MQFHLTNGFNRRGHSATHPKASEASLSYSLDKVAQLNTSNTQDAVFMRYLAQQARASMSSAERREIKKSWTLKLNKQGFYAVAEKLNRCHAFIDAHLCENNHSFNIKVDFRCYLPFCPDCNHEKSMRELARTLPKFLQALRDDPHLIIALLTPTLRSRKERKLRAGCKEVKGHFKTLRKNRVWKNCVAGVGRVENTYSKVHGWHPHIHSLVLLKDYIDQKQLSDAWQKITGDSKVVDIRKVHNLTEGLLEAIKYPFKPGDIKTLGREQIAEMLVLKGERLGVTFGAIYGMEVEAEEADELQTFVAETKDLKDGDCCPICKTRIRLFLSVPRERYESLVSSVQASPKASRGHPPGH
jgi:rubredoxin